MINLSLMQRFNILKSIILNSGKTIYIIPALLLIMFIIMIISFKKKSKLTKLSIVLYILTLGFLGYIYNSHLITMYDYLVGYIVDYVLFPNLAIYVGMLVITNLMVFISLLDKDIKYSIKNINILFFTLIALVQFFIIRTISVNNIDIYEKLTVYSNQDLLVLIQFSMIIFVIWIISLLTIKLINYITNKITSKEVKVEINTEEHVSLKGNYAMKVSVLNNQMIPDYSNVTVNKFNVNKITYDIKEFNENSDIINYNKELNNLSSFDEEDYIPRKKVHA